jgi:alpha-tubulin suppressor-like RCC1 family protein
MPEPRKEVGYTEFFSWGQDSMGQLGHGSDLKAPKPVGVPKSLSFEVYIRQISCGTNHSAFVSKEGHLFTFGSNIDGQLGINDQNMKHSSAPLLVPDLLNQSV